MFFEKLLCCFASLPDALAAVRVPGAAFFYDAHFAAEVDDFPISGDSGAVKNIEFRLLERRRHFVFHDLNSGAAADNIVAILERADAADVHSHRGVEFKGVAASG